jgi:predicted nuclease of predicted toxin-antitoxin system
MIGVRVERLKMGWKKLPSVTEKQSRDFVRFRKKARFLVDESLGEGVARILRDHGWNAIFAPDIGLRGRSDEDVFAYAWKDDRVLLTHDRDFLDDRRFPPHRNPGVIVLPGASGTGEGLGSALRSVVSIIGPSRKAFRRFKVEITQDGVWNIQSLIRVSDEARKWRLRFGNDEVYEWEEEE